MDLTLRVYGLLIREERYLLLSEEWIQERLYTKFPGGGLIPGEGIVDCLCREWQEETQTRITDYSHLYTTEFFVHSAFRPHCQVVCIYYLVTTETWPRTAEDSLKELSQETLPAARRLCWRRIGQLHAQDFSFETDAEAFKRLCKIYG